MFEDKVLKHKRAEGYYRRNAELGNVDGAWKNFVEANKVHEPRNMFNGGGLTMDVIRVLQDKQNFRDAWKNYKKSTRGSRPLSSGQFFEIWARENMATGGSAGQLVQNTVDGSRPGYDGDTSKVYNEKTGHIYKKGNRFKTVYSKTPTLNQHKVNLKDPKYTDEVIKFIDDNPTLNQKEGAKILGKQRAKLVNWKLWGNPGPKWNDEKAKIRNEANKAWTKKYSNISIEDKTRGDMKIHRQHAGGLREPVGTENTMFLESKKNTTEIRPFEKAIDDIQLKQYQTELNRNMPIEQKRKIFADLKKQEATLRAANPEFSKYKSSLIFEESALSPKTGYMKKEVMSNPELTISEGKTGQKFKYKNVKPASEEGKKIIELSKKSLEAKVKDMETMLVKLCPRGGNASGGRIGFNLGSGAACGAKFLEEKLKDGKGTKVERRLMAEIISKGAGIKNFLKGALNPLELLNPKNFIGPQAIALMGAFEVGDVTYDVINNNKPIKEALGDNWILKYASPYNAQEEQVKALEAKNISGSPAMQTYMEKIKLQAEFEREYKKLEKLKKDTPSKNNPKVQEQIKEQQAVVDNLKNNWKQFVADKTIDVNGEKVVTLESGKQDFEQAFGQIIEKRQGGEYVTADDKQSLIKTYIEGESEGKYINTGADWANSGDLSHITGQHPYKYKMDLGKDQGRNISETEREARKLFPFETGSIKADYTKPTYKDFNYKSKKLPTELRQKYEKWATEQGVLDPSYPLKSSLSQLPMQDGSNFLEMLTKDYNVLQKAEQASMYPGYGGTQEPAKYAEGGIANTRVGFKTGSSIASLLSKFFKPKKTITIKRGESGTIGASGNSRKDFFNRYYFPPKGGFTNQSADARYFSKLGGPKGKPKVLTAEITPQELKEGYRLRSLDSKDPEIGDIIIPQSAKDKVKTDYYNTIRARIEKILKNND